MAVQPDGKIVLAGLTAQGDTGDFALARYDNSGALDTDFDTDGLVTTDFSSTADWAFGVAVQSDGKIVAAGISHPRQHRLRLRAGALPRQWRPGRWLRYWWAGDY